MTGGTLQLAADFFFDAYCQMKNFFVVLELFMG